MKPKFTFFLLFTFSFLTVSAQVEFEENIVLDDVLYIQSPHSVFSADLDGDGDMDILTSSYFGNRFVWIENIDGTGEDIVVHTIDANVQAPWGVHAADLDGDGDLDVMVACLSSNNVIWYENTDGNGNFVQKQALYAYKANFLRAVDIDDDGDLDIVWSSTSDSKIKWIRNDGLGTFGLTFNIDTNASGVRNFYIADVDNNGSMDIVSSFFAQGGQGVVWYKNTNGNFGNRILISNVVDYVTSVYAGDLDGDGDIDVVSASSGDNKIAWYENLDGNATFGTQQVLSLAVNGASVVRIADVDDDGDLDIIFASNDDSKIAWLENLDSTGSFSGEIFISSHSGDLRDIHFSDMDGDGDLDFLTASNNNIILFKNTNGGDSFASNILTKHINGGRIVFTGDIDGDGDMDIVAASYWDDKISWFENLDGQGNFHNTQKIISETIDGATSVFVGDVDGDGFNDVLATSYLSDSVVWFKNIDGLGTFADPQIIDDNLYQASRVYLADIDNDGDMDVFALGRGRITWYTNLDGQGNFSTQQTIDNINNFLMYDIDFGDLDGDGDLDISVASSYGRLYYLNQDGQGTFGSKQIIAGAFHRAVSTKIADLDNDGDNDIVYVGENTFEPSFVGWTENLDGLGAFGEIQIISSIISNPKSVIVADFDNDGDMDVATASQENGGVIAWYKNTDGLGDFTNTQQILLQTSNSPYDIFAADIDGNNTIDIVSISFDNKIAWHKNLGIVSSNSISGTVRFGCDDADMLLSSILLVATGYATTDATFSQENGHFQIYTTEEGIVTTQVISQFPTYYMTNPASHESNFIGFGNSDSVDFCVEPIAGINDLIISVYPIINAPRPGFDTGYRIFYRNIGTTQLSGSISFEFDGSKLNLLGASETVSSQTATEVIFDFTDLNPFEMRTIDLSFNVFTPPTTNIDDVLISTVTINPITGDYTPEDNIYNLRQVVVGSFDPNDITCLEGDEVLIENADKYLHYLIRFQNTGTASAINVRVEHILDDKLDWTSMQLESLSHSSRVNIHNGSKVTFTFDNINLPDSTNDEPNSHGFIAFKIKPVSDVVIGDTINATADIYFDFNPAIVTNTASTTFIETLSVVKFGTNKVTVYPNPTKGILNLKAQSVLDRVSIYDLNSRLLSSEQLNMESFEHQINLESLSEGIYFLEVKSGNTKQTIKFIKN